MRFVGITVAMIGLSTNTLLAQPPASELVRTRLVADVSAIEPGKPFSVGVIFDIEPGWHIYWINPGDSGMATTIELKVPPGFRASGLQFPTPVKFTQPGDIVGYGYTNQVLLAATVYPPANLKTDEKLSFGADVKFLVCEKVCIPGQANLELKLPVVQQSQRAEQPLFDSWKSQLPLNAPDAGANISQSFDWDSRKLKIQIDWKADAPKSAEWFPPAAPDASFTDIRVMNAGPKRTIISATCSPLARKPIEQKIYRSVLAYDAADGSRRAVNVSFVPGPDDGIVISQD